MKKILNTSLVILIQILSINFCQAQTSPIIAENFDKTIQLTNIKLQEWLKYNSKLQYYEKNTQIESYFIQQLLLNKRQKLDNILNTKIDFFHDRDSYQSSVKIKKKQLFEQVKINDDAFQEQFKQLKNIHLNKKDKVRIYQIFKRYPPQATQQTKDKVMQSMKKIRSQVEKLDDFKKLAIKESNAQSRLQKGLIGNVYSGQFDPHLDNIVMKMQADELSQIIDLPSGLVLFYCEKIIPIKPKTNDQLREITTNKMQTAQSEQKWQDYQQLTLKNINPIYDWDIIKNKADKQAIVAKTLLSQLSKQQLLWLLNGYNGHKSLSKFSNEEITSKVQNYFVSKNIFSHLATDVKGGILAGIKSQYIERIISEVMVMLVKPRMVVLSEQDIQSYYDTHKHKLMTNKAYDISALGLEINKNNRKKVYQKIESIYYDISLGADFDLAIQEYSIIQKKFPHLNLKHLNDSRLSGIFGARIANSIRVMPQGKISDLIETSSGYLWLVRLNAIIDPRLYKLAEVRQYVEDRLNSQQANEWQDLITTELLDKQKISIYLNKSVLPE